MPDSAVIETPAAETAPLTPAEKFEAYKAAKAAAATPEAIAKAVADKAAAAAAPVVPEKRASGDERKFNRKLRLRDEQIGAMRAELDALKTKGAPSVATVDPAAAPKRADFADDAAYDEARIAHVAKREIGKRDAEAAQAAEVRETIDGYNARIADGPKKYDDWDAVIKGGQGAALSVDLGKECPSLFWAIAKSPNNDDLFYTFCKDSKQLQNLIDIYKSGPKGEQDALVAFHRLEGKVAREAKAPDKLPAKAETAVPEVKPKPKPSAETVVRGGAAAPDGKPPLYVPGTHTLNPAYKAWQRTQHAR
jgi:hypothetical protein